MVAARTLFALTLIGAIGCGDDGAPMMSLDGGAPPDAGELDLGPMVDDDGGPGGDDMGVPDMGPPPPEPPADIFFVGNSFTLGGPIPLLVQDLAVSAGFPEPNVDYRAVGGRTLEWHRADPDPESAPERIAEGWDVVVLQEYSTRPTDAVGPAERFKEDATYFHDLAIHTRPSARVILYETWARREGHSLYPVTFDDPGDMQAQLRFHYFDAADNYIPMMAMETPNVTVAPCGDAWERQLAGGEPPILHAGDDYHAGAAGQYLNALVLYSTIYGYSALGLAPIGVDADVARELQETADATTGITRPPPALGDPVFPVGQAVRIDVGPTAADWPALTSASDSVGPLTTDDGESTTAGGSSAAFDGTQTGGLGENDFGWPADVSADSLWVGSFDGHDAALGRSATLRFRGLPAGTYELVLYASRTGDDAGNGRLTRFTVGSETRDLDPVDNTGRTATFDALSPDALGELSVAIAVSPDGGARFGYLGAAVLTRLD